MGNGKRMTLSTIMRMREMKKILTVLVLMVFAVSPLFAQDGPEKKRDGAVTVHQSDDINKVVNGPGKSSSESAPAAKEPEKSKENTASHEKASEKKSERRPEKKSEAEKERDKERRAKEIEAREAARDKRVRESESAAGATSTSKKVMSNGRRVMGYRVQVFAGRNTRADREKAQEAGRKIKKEMPGQPVYVHFYSPRWVCRIGNYAKEEDANSLLKRVKNLGYKTACVVKSPVTVSVRRR